jgi:alkaline phosphatase
MIPVLAFGPGAEAFSSFYENTAIFDKMMKALKLK